MVQPISALRFSSTRYPGFGLTQTSGYQPPAAVAADVPAAPSPAGAELIRPQDREGQGRDDGTGGPPSIGSPATLSEAYRTGKFLDNPLAQVAAAAVPFPLNALLQGVRAITTGTFASDEQKQFNSTVETAGNPTPYDRVNGDRPIGGLAEATAGLNSADETSDFGEVGQGGGAAETAGGLAEATAGINSADETGDFGGDGGDRGSGGDFGRGNDPGGGAAGSPFHQGGPIPESRVPGVTGADTQETLQEGEYVVQKSAADALGPEQLAQINAAGTPGGPPGANGGGGVVGHQVMGFMAMSPQEQDAFISTIEAIQAQGQGGQPGGPAAASPPLPGGGAPALPGGAPGGPAGVPPGPPGGAAISSIPRNPRGPSTSLAGQKFRR